VSPGKSKSSFSTFYDSLDEHGLKEEVWQVLGGNPNSIGKLVKVVESGTDFKLDVVEFLFHTLNCTHGAILEEMKFITGLNEL